MRTLTVETVDPRDESALRAWFSVVAAVNAVDEARAPQPDFDDLLGGIPDPADPYDRWRLWIALAGNEPVGAAKVEVSADSPQLVCMRLMVRPEQRRHGIGSALLAAVESWALAAGCALMNSETTQWAGAPSVPGIAFAERFGYYRGRITPRRELSPPADPGPLSIPGYSVRTWVDACPDDLVASRAELSRLFSTDDPANENRHEETWDSVRVRADEERTFRRGRTTLTSAAIHDDTGETVAFTMLGRPRADVEHAFQLETVVARAHRGRRLGSLVKVENLRALAAYWPSVRRISAFNDSSNQPMIAINEALGFRVVAEIIDWEKSLI
jgi:GNAT superfamily N-acetyltransferase